MINYSKSILKRWPIALAMLSLVIFSNCGEDDDAASLFANFSYSASADNFLEVTFTDLSEGASTYEWNFGDGSGTSTDQNPTYSFAAAGTYTVTLTVGDGTSTDSYSEDVEIVDPDEALTLLTGVSSKTWKLVREGTAMLLASDPNYTDIYWPGSSNNGQRSCLYDDEFTFHRDGTYEFNDGGTFWAEYGVFNGGVGASGCDSNTTPEGCFEAIASNMVNECGDDVSAWLSGTHSFEYNVADSKITLTGNGAWIGIPKLGTSTDTNVTPQSNVAFDVVLREGGSTGVDTMYVSFTYAGTFWPITYVSYNDESLEPALVSVNADFGASAVGLTATFTNQSSGANSYAWDFGDGGTSTEENPSHTYATEGTYSVTLTATGDDGSGSITKEVTVSEATLDTPAPTPTQDAATVISIYSDAYTNIDGVNTNPNWGQATVVTGETVQGDNVLLLTGLNYQGIDFSGNQQDVSGKTTIHVDFWAAADATINFSLISPGPLETPYSVSITGGQWNSLDIALSEFSDVVNLSEVFQMKFDDAGSGASPTFYVDNIYFY